MKKVVVFTSTRADYGLLYHLIKSFADDDRCELKILITGTHLSKDFGMTVNQIDPDLLKYAVQIPLNLSGAESEIFAEAFSAYSKFFESNKIDVGVVLGDRFEALAFGLSGFMANIEIAHLHGGETTAGAKDDSYRHCLTVLSKKHFVAHEIYKEKVIKLGAAPETVFNVGALGLEYLQKFTKISKEELAAKTQIKFREKNLLITFHAETHSPGKNLQYVKTLLESLDKIQNCSFIFTMPNIDPESNLIRNEIVEFSKTNSAVQLFENLGSVNYLNVMRFVNAVVGNSSSGIYEAPFLKIPTINIGNRQEGRIKAPSVIDVPVSENEITGAIKSILDDKYSVPEFQYPFGDTSAFKKISEKILS